MMGFFPSNMLWPPSLFFSQSANFCFFFFFYNFCYCFWFCSRLSLFLGLISERKAVKPQKFLLKELNYFLLLPLSFARLLPGQQAALLGKRGWFGKGRGRGAGRQEGGMEGSAQPRWGRGRTNEKHMPTTILKAGLSQGKWWIARMCCVHSWGAGRNSLARGLGWKLFFTNSDLKIHFSLSAKCSNFETMNGRLPLSD